MWNLAGGYALLGLAALAVAWTLVAVLMPFFATFVLVLQRCRHGRR